MNKDLQERIKKLFAGIATDVYKLNNDKSISRCDILEWSKQIEDPNLRKIAHDTINGIRISTVWLGLDHGYELLHPPGSEYKPVLFETMVFAHPDNMEDCYCDRYCTYDEALTGHQQAIEWVKHEYTQK